MQNELRNRIKQCFQLNNFILRKDSLDYLTDYFQNLDENRKRDLLDRIIDTLRSQQIDATLLDLNTLKRVISESTRYGGAKRDTAFKVTNSNEWPKMKLDTSTGKFLASDENKRIMKKPFECLKERLNLILDALDTKVVALSTVESLFPRNHALVTVLGMLCRGETSETYLIEDLTGHLQLDLSKAEFENGIVCEGGFYFFTGIYDTGLLTVQRVSLPKIVPDYFYRIRNLPPKWEINDRIVFLSDVWLDDPKVTRAVYHLLSGFSTCPPHTIVLCGHFLSTYVASGYTEKTITAFRHLGNIFAEFATYYVNTQFVFVPGPDDPPLLTVFPKPQLMPNFKAYFKDAKNLHWASNPCMITCNNQTLVVYRDDLVEKACRNAIHVPKNANDISKHFCDLIWSQRHVSPLPFHVNPIISHLDYLYHLCPTPDLLVIADKYIPFIVEESPTRRLTINPGSFPRTNFEFQVYYPSLKKVEASSIDL